MTPNPSDAIYIKPPTHIPCITPIFGCLFGLILLFACMAGTPLLCVLTLTAGNPDPLQASFRPDPTLAQEYEVSFAEAVQQGTNSSEGNFELQITEEQFASWLSVYFDELEATQDLSFENPLIETQPKTRQFQVVFADQRLQIYTTLPTATRVDLAIFIEAEVVPNPDTGNIRRPLQVNVKKLQWGAIELPQTARNEIGDIIADVLTERFAFNQAYRINSPIVLEAGVLRMSGQLAQ